MAFKVQNKGMERKRGEEEEEEGGGEEGVVGRRKPIFL